MGKYNPKNERTKRRYAQYMSRALGLSEASIDKALAAISRFEESTRWKDFGRFHIEQAVAFKNRLDAEINPASRKPLAKGTVTAILKALRAFFRWLSQEPGYTRRLRATDADYFNPSKRDDRIARGVEQRPSPSLEQVRCAHHGDPATDSMSIRPPNPRRSGHRFHEHPATLA